jgi:hypothetical protein
MDENELEDHPKHHLEASALSADVRLPTGEVSCEQVLKLIARQFIT